MPNQSKPNKAHIEKSISVTLNGIHHVISSGDNERQMTMTVPEAIRRAERTGETGPGFSRLDEADNYARMRSKNSENNWDEVESHIPKKARAEAMKRMAEGAK